MRHARLERWSRLDSPIHRHHPTAKILAALALLISIATLTKPAILPPVAYLMLLVTSVVIARLPIPSLLAGAAAVLPFALCFAIVSALAGQPARAVMLLVRGYLSSLTALLLIATTSMPDVLIGLESLRAPRFLLQVMQFLYRYLIVLVEEAASMRDAGASRAASLRALEFRKAAGVAGVLFARAYNRAQAIHLAMIARGFDGHIPRFLAKQFRPADAAFVIAAVAFAVGIRTVLG